MRISKENTVCLVIDIQERLFPAMAGKEEFLERAIRLVRGMQILQVPLLVTQQYTKGLGETIPEIRNCFEEFNFIEKKDFSCVDEPSFKQKIKESEAFHILVCGIESHVCVLQTVVDLKSLGLNPVVAVDAITSRHVSDFKFALERFRHEGIMMTSVETILFELTRSSASPSFREISRLVK